MKRTLWQTAAGVGIVFLVLLLVWAGDGFASLGIGGSELVALVLGILFTTLVAAGLMALVFYSNRSAQDEAVYHATDRERTDASTPPRPGGGTEGGAGDER